MGKKQDDNDNKIEEQVEESVEQEVVDQPEVTREEFDKLQGEFNSLQELSAQLEGQLKRAVADYQNLEKRISDGRSELSTWATSELLKKLLAVVDNFEKATKGASEEDRKSGWFKGVEMALKQLHQVLKDEGLGEIETDGQFDPSLHEAIDTRDGENDQVLETLEKGYTLYGKILRPARVVIGRKVN